MSDNTQFGFVGRKVAGKSTLIGVLLGKETLDNGEVIRHPKRSIRNVNLMT